jgi:hypothetical protein
MSNTAEAKLDHCDRTEQIAASINANPIAQSGDIDNDVAAWIEAAVPPEDIDGWLSVSVWDAGACAKLRAAGVTSDQFEGLDQEKLDGIAFDGSDLAYMYCNGDVSLARVLEVLK